MMKSIGLIVLGLLALTVCGCRGTRVITVDVPRIEKEYIVSTDTVHQYDSVFVFNDRRIERDTVYLTQISQKYRYLYKMRTDTLLRTDTITLIDTKQIKALTDENDALKATMYFYRTLGFCLIGIIAIMGLYFILKK